jgi:hypothetical protein
MLPQRLEVDTPDEPGPDEPDMQSHLVPPDVVGGVRAPGGREADASRNVARCRTLAHGLPPPVARVLPGVLALAPAEWGGPGVGRATRR